MVEMVNIFIMDWADFIQKVTIFHLCPIPFSLLEAGDSFRARALLNTSTCSVFNYSMLSIAQSLNIIQIWCNIRFYVKGAASLLIDPSRLQNKNTRVTHYNSTILNGSVIRNPC